MESNSRQTPPPSTAASLAEDDPGSDRPRSAPYITAKMALALSVAARVRILAELNERAMSPSQYAREFELERTSTCRHFRKLEEVGYLEMVEEVPGQRGAPQKVFRATQISVFDTAMWERLPESIRRDYSCVIWETYGRRVNQALEAGTLDADVDRHFSWKPLVLDKQGWTDFVTALDSLLDWVMDLEVESAARMAESGEESITATVGLAGFRSPKSAQGGPPVR